MKLVVPRFSAIFKASKMELPMPTQILLLMNTVMEDYGLYLLFMAVVW